MKKKSIALNVLFFFMIGLLLLISGIYVFTKIKNASKSVYCYGTSIFSKSEDLEECKRYIIPVEKIDLNLSLIESERALGVYIVKCWNKANKGFSNSNITCYSIEFLNQSIYNKYFNKTRLIYYISNVSDVNISRIIFIESNTADDILFDKNIGDYRTLIIYYNGSHIIIW